MAQVAKPRGTDGVGAPPGVVHEHGDDVVKLQSPSAAGDPFVVVVARRSTEAEAAAGTATESTDDGTDTPE